MIYTFKYRSENFNDTVSLEVAHSGHTPQELYQYAMNALFGISDDDDDYDFHTKVKNEVVTDVVTDVITDVKTDDEIDDFPPF